MPGSTPLNRSAPRFSSDIDVFHDLEERVADAATADARLLTDHGYRLEWLRKSPMIYTAEVTRGSERTRLDWVMDSDYRYFPTVKDELFGYVLHPVDLAMNKVMAAAGRRELRDLVDLLTIHERVLPLGAVVWAAVEKAPGFTPEGLIAEIRRNSNFPLERWRRIESAEPLDPKVIMPRLLKALDEADAFVAQMPTDKAGLLFLRDGRVVQPDPARLGEYQTHAGARRGTWPTSFEIETAMLEHYQKPQA